MKFFLLILFSILIFSASILGQTISENEQNSTYSESSAFKPVRKIEPYQPQIRKSDKKKTKKNKEKETDEKILDVPQSKEIIFPVSVSDQNADFVKGFSKQNFKVFEDGIEQQINYFYDNSNPLTVVLIMDTSASSIIDIKKIRSLAEKFIGQVNSQNKFVIAELNEQFSILNYPTNDRKELEKIIKKLRLGTGTSIYDGIAQISQKINLIEGQKVIVFFTDGVDTVSQKVDYLESLSFAEKSNTAFFPIYFDTYFRQEKLKKVSKKPNSRGSSLIQNILKNSAVSFEEEYELGEQYLQELAAYTGGKVIKLENEEDGLEKAFSRAVEVIENLYFIGFDRQNPENHVREIKVRINRPNLTVLARENYFFGQN